MPLPPPPTQDSQGSYAWLEWFRQLRNYITQVGSVPWSIIDFTGSTLSSIASRSHQVLQALQGGTTGEYYHLTANEHSGASQSNIDASKLLGNTWASPEAIGSTTPAAITGTTVKASNAAGFISSDGSTGYTGTVTSASLVGKTITIKDGIITGFS